MSLDPPMAGDPLDDPSPRRAAEHAHLEALLRCWLTESGAPAIRPGPLVAELPALGLALHTYTRHASPTGWHRFGPVTLARSGGVQSSGSVQSSGGVQSRPALPLDPTVAVAIVATEAAARGGARHGGVPAGEVGDLVARTADSVNQVTTFIAARRAAPTRPAGVDGFLDAEQALVLGHLRHPAPKSRDCAADAGSWSPELRACLPLHWFAADPEIVGHDAVAGSPSLHGHDTPGLLRELAGSPPGTSDRILLPAHPWQAADLLRRPDVAALVEAGRLTPLGELGRRWWPTSSLRTVYSPDAPVMLKLSLGLRLTNSRREATATELRRGLEIHRLLDAGYAGATATAHPEFSIVRDPAWAAVRTAAGGLTGLDVAVREVPAGVADLRCLAGLVAPRPGQGTSMLAGLPAAAADPARWTAVYAAMVLVPMLHLYAATGIGLEAHQQNTLVRLGPDGSVRGGAFRDNQGYYLAASRLPAVLARTAAAESTLAVVDDDVVDERLCYYLLRNQVLAVVGCLAVDGLADETELLGVLRDVLQAALPALAAAGPEGDRLARRWLTAATLPCKANMLTRLHGIDEVIAPLDAQSVYLDAPNPLAAAT